MDTPQDTTPQVQEQVPQAPPSPQDTTPQVPPAPSSPQVPPVPSSPPQDSDTDSDTDGDTNGDTNGDTDGGDDKCPPYPECPPQPPKEEGTPIFVPITTEIVPVVSVLVNKPKICLQNKADTKPCYFEKKK